MVSKFSKLVNRIERRRFLQLAAAVAISPTVLQCDRYARAKSFGNDPFTLGVASGEPSHDGFVIWTRLAPDPLNGGGMTPEPVQVHWQVAKDEAFRNVLREGDAPAVAALGHSVHVELAGLEPESEYWYRFQVADAVSQVGRAKTTPHQGKLSGELRMAFASCQHYETGYYHAYRDMVGRGQDVIIHLGDYIYEGAAIAGRVRSHLGAELNSLEEYRNRYALYKSDASLRAAHAHCPWIVTWDDHEFDNNYAADHSEEANVDPVAFLERRARAYQAYYEHMPLRISQLPTGPHLQLYRSVSYGNLVQFHVLDTRQYRSPQPCGDGNKPPCDGVYSEGATMLGATQEAWLRKNLLQSTARWNVLAQQVMMARVDRNPTEGVAWSMDQWAGYDMPRKRLLNWIAENHVSNPVVLTGDIHSNWVNDLRVDFDDSSSPTVATEFVGTSVSSGGDGSDVRKDTEGVLRDNAFVKFYNAERGYVSCVIQPDRWISDYRVVSTVTQPEFTAQTRAEFVVQSGRPGAERAV